MKHLVQDDIQVVGAIIVLSNGYSYVSDKMRKQVDCKLYH